MGERYYRWLELMAERDAILLPLSAVAISLLLAWLLVPVMVPARYQRGVQLAYMAGGAVLYVLAILGG